MPDTRQVQSNGVVSNSSSRSVDGLEEAVERLKIQEHDNQDGGAVAHSCPYPDRPGEPNCNYYLRTGLCGYGSKCRFNHPTSPEQVNQYNGELPERVGQPDCGYYLKTGTCKYGSACKYHHPREKHGGGALLLNILGLPMRQEENTCPFYMRTGLCKFGVACKFHHPQPASSGSYFPVPGPAAYGSPSSSVAPSSGLHFVGVPGVSLTRAPYISGPSVQVPQTYMPVVLPSSQGIAPAHGWNTYLSDSSFGGLEHLSTSLPNPPERPNQPECRHFMSTGSCKYGSDCKYHHPRERIAPLTTNFLGPLGLPLRPGQPVCSYYSLYGLCKYGPTCKYDHPLPGYPYNYGFGIPTLYGFDPSFFPYQRNSTNILSLEPSPLTSASVGDWVRKPEMASNKNQNLDTIESLENSSEQAGSPPHSSPASPDVPHDQTD